MQDSISRIIRGVMFGLLIVAIVASTACSDVNAAPPKCQYLKVEREVRQTRRISLNQLVAQARKDSSLAQVQWRREQVKAVMERIDSIGAAKVESARIIDSIAGCLGR